MKKKYDKWHPSHAKLIQLVKRIAQRYPAIPYDDAVSVGLEALLDAIQSFGGDGSIKKYVATAVYHALTNYKARLTTRSKMVARFSEANMDRLTGQVDAIDLFIKVSTFQAFFMALDEDSQILIMMRYLHPEMSYHQLTTELMERFPSKTFPKFPGFSKRLKKLREQFAKELEE